MSRRPNSGLKSFAIMPLDLPVASIGPHQEIGLWWRVAGSVSEAMELIARSFNPNGFKNDAGSIPTISCTR